MPVQPVPRDVGDAPDPDDGAADAATAPPDGPDGPDPAAGPDDAPVRHIFLFRCNDCGRVAHEGRWVLHDNTPTVRATHIRAYPSPECPGCGSLDIDMDHGVRYIAADDPRPAPWTKAHDHDHDDDREDDASPGGADAPGAA